MTIFKTAAAPKSHPARDELIEWGDRYAQYGFTPIALDARSKAATGKGWQTETHAHLEHHAVDGGNLGLLLGSPSGGLADVDLDSDIAVQLAPHFLPPTPWRSGHAIPEAHWWYDAEGDLGTRRQLYKDPTAQGERLLFELRSTGHQTVVPP